MKHKVFFVFYATFLKDQVYSIFKDILCVILTCCIRTNDDTIPDSAKTLSSQVEFLFKIPKRYSIRGEIPEILKITETLHAKITKKWELRERILENKTLSHKNVNGKPNLKC